jgi:DNA-binding SARP family transcriptional activator
MTLDIAHRRTMTRSRKPTPEPGAPPEIALPAALRLCLLGGFQVTLSDRTIAPAEWKLRKAAALVKLLALTPGHRRHREEVLDLLWPEFDPDTARHNLKQTLYVARRVLEPGLAGRPSRYLPLQGDFLLLHPGGPVETDLAAFVEAATAARHGGLPGHYVAALAHYGGDLLPEDRYEEWTQGPREEARGLYLALLSELARLYERRGSNADAIATLERLVAAEPTDEAAHVGLMRLHALSGQRQQALRQYQQLRDILRRELDVAPEPATQR